MGKRLSYGQQERFHLVGVDDVSRQPSYAPI